MLVDDPNYSRVLLVTYCEHILSRIIEYVQTEFAHT